MQLFLVFLLSLHLVFSTNVQLTLRFIDNARSLNAVCNDGSNYGFYYRANNLDKWVIHLQGGSWCWDEQSCKDRYANSPGLMSSKPWGTTMGISGLFDQNQTANPHWYDASYAYLPYCSSDSFSGSRDPSNDTYNWEFRGHTIINATIQTLLPLGLSTASTVLLSGCSAGGAATIANADYVGSLLPPLNGRSYRSHNDAGFFLDVVPYNYQPGNFAYGYTFQKGQPLWNGMPDDTCTKFYPKSEWWKCYMGQYLMVSPNNFISTPMLVHQETVDSAHLGADGLPNPSTWNTDQQAYANQFRINMTQVMSKLASPHAIYAPSCYYHCITEGGEFQNIVISQTTLTDEKALGSWYFDKIDGNNVDLCNGFSCSGNCPGY